jgi:hypothetical protein
MAQNVIKFHPRDAAKNPDHVLELANGVYNQVLVIGYDKDGKLDVRASLNFKTKDIFFAMEVFKSKILRGDYNDTIEELEEANYE